MSLFTPYFNETHEQVRLTARQFIQREVLPHINAWEEAGSFPREIYRKAGAAGLLGIGHDPAYGGTGEDVFMKIAATEEVMRSTSGGFAASLGSLDIALPPLEKWGSQALKDRFVGPVLAGDMIAALAITEPSGGSDVASLRTRAERRHDEVNGDHYVVNGSKIYITSGIRADFYVAAVRTGGPGYAGVSLLVIERSRVGVSTGQPLKKMGWWASDTAEVFFDNVIVPAENLIGSENAGFLLIMSNFQMERLNLAVMANMTAQMALEEAIRWSREREAFGKAIGRLQVIRHKLADMATRIEASREFTYRVGARIADGIPSVKEVSMAKNFATQTSDFVTTEAVQIFGGMGYMRESVVERLYRDNRILSIGGGTYEIMNEVIAKQLGID
ncbi:acyl-CoA dehydrogenase family protein [Perlucidibaca piscinae]|uniref:acyl-CoA dehydrogenase family protein n=1 Tax=Perlucidibaca piscinae TaxID=392589 RepID=UPI0003B37ED1|nr:acyl-CoA dehydrogenase family protein [Perlucidibaca piscinae]